VNRPTASNLLHDLIVDDLRMALAAVPSDLKIDWIDEELQAFASL
jgi:hypothetical protein